MYDPQYFIHELGYFLIKWKISVSVRGNNQAIYTVIVGRSDLWMVLLLSKLFEYVCLIQSNWKIKPVKYDNIKYISRYSLASFVIYIYFFYKGINTSWV